MGRLASTWFDPVIGLDLHLQIVLRPPLPPFVFIFPHPYVGLVFDPIGLIIGLALTNAIGAITGSSGLMGPVLVNCLPATNAGTESIGLPVLHWPYMGMWVPFPRVTPPVRPGKPVKPPLPIPPNDAIIITGSDSVMAMGASMSRMGDIALSCSDPIRLPTSFIIAIPKGRPVLVGGGTSIDFFSAAMGILSSRYITGPIRRFMSNRYDDIATRLRNSRLRNLWPDIRCFFTGHPVDVATGRVMVHACDWTIRGVSGLAFERRYFSSWCRRRSVLGYGWTHSYDEAIWLEPGRVVLKKGDGREIEFQVSFDDLARDAQLRDGELFEPLSRLWLRRSDGEWQLRDSAGERRVYRSIDPADPRARLVSIERRGGLTTTFEYAAGRLERIRDAVGRVVQLRYDEGGALIEIQLPHPHDADSWQTQVRYSYSDEGDLVAVENAVGAVSHYGYQDHLLVQETDPNGNSFYFGYDGRSDQAACVRTWGEGGLLDHVIDYDKERRVTRVYDSYGCRTKYRMNACFAVVEVEDAQGATTVYSYDDNLWLSSVRNALGETIGYRHDAYGRLVETAHPDDSFDRRSYDERGRLTRRVDRRGGEWHYRYDERDLLLEEQGPEGALSRLRYDARGLCIAVEMPGGRRVLSARDEWGNDVKQTDPAGRVTTVSYDRLGRAQCYEGAFGRRLISWDVRGLPVRIDHGEASWQQLSFDGAGNLVEEARSDGRVFRYRYNALDDLAAIESNGNRLAIQRDRENRVVEIMPPDGRSIRYERDALGRVVLERKRDLLTHRYGYDAVGRLIAHRQPDGTTTRYSYLPAARQVSLTLSDGDIQSFQFDPMGQLLEASNRGSRVRYERDLLGRVTKEWINDEWVASSYDESGRRDSMAASGGFSVSIERDESASSMTLTTPRGAVTLVADQAGGRASHGPGALGIEWLRDAHGLAQTRVVRCGEREVWRRRYHWQDGQLMGWSDGDGQQRISRDGHGRPIAMERTDGSLATRRLDELGRPHAAEAFVYDDGGRVLRAGPYLFKYNALGQLADKQHEDGRHWRYRFDGIGRLSEVTCDDGTLVRYRYDAIGRCLEHRAGGQVTRWRWDQQRVFEQQQGEVTKQWLYHPTSQLPLAEIQGPDMFAVVTDGVGTVQALVDQAGDVRRQPLDLFGRLDGPPAGDAATPLRFLGQWADDKAKLHYNRHRFYDPDVGRYISPDPIGLRGGMDPYGYVGDPLAQVDVMGLVACDARRWMEGLSGAAGKCDENAETILARIQADATSGVDRAGRLGIGQTPGAEFSIRMPDGSWRTGQDNYHTFAVVEFQGSTLVVDPTVNPSGAIPLQDYLDNYVRGAQIDEFVPPSMAPPYYDPATGIFWTSDRWDGWPA